MKIGCCVVLYNPNDGVIENISAYLSFAEKIVVVDNSIVNIDNIENTLRSWDKIVYLKQNGNVGIAKALNIGLTYLYDLGYEWALTMDQDSKFPVDHIEEILKLVEKYSREYSIIGLRYDSFEDKSLDENDEIFDVKYWITSGNFVNLHDYRNIGGFNDDLFIDHVDHEFCRQLKLKGKCVGILKNYSLNHKIGTGIKHMKFLWKTCSVCVGHPPIRSYYQIRNIIFLYNIDKNFYEETLKITLIQIFVAVMYGKEKFKRIKMICKGFHDGIKKNLGVYM